MGKYFMCVLVAVVVLSSSSVAEENNLPCIYDAECPNKDCCIYDIRYTDFESPRCGMCSDENRKYGTKTKPKLGNKQGSICRLDKECNNKTLCCESQGKPVNNDFRVGTCDDCSVISGYNKGALCLYDTECPDQKCCLYLTKYDREGKDSVCGNCNVEKRKRGTKVKPKVKTMLGQLCRIDQNCEDKKLWCAKPRYLNDASEYIEFGKCQDNTWKDKYEKSQNTDACLLDQDCKSPTDCCIRMNNRYYMKTFCHNCVGMNTVREPKRKEPLDFENLCRKDADCPKKKS